MARTSADIRAQLVQAIETMAYLIRSGSIQAREVQERRVNRLRKNLRDAEAREMRDARTVASVAARLGVDAADLVRSLGANVGPATRLNEREISFLTAAFTR